VVVNPTEQNQRLLDMLGVSEVLPVVAQSSPTELEFVVIPASPMVSPLQRLEIIQRAHQHLIELNQTNVTKFSAFLEMLEVDLEKHRGKSL
jgi:hypothetical protein